VTGLLDRVQATHAFDSKLRDLDLADYHVPFDEIHGYTQVEAELQRAAGVYERTSIIGPIGSGKTSLARYVLDGQLEETRFAPIWISVAFDGPEVVSDPRRFAAHVIQAIDKQARDAGALDQETRQRILAAASERRPLEGLSVATSSQLAANFWALDARLGRDVTRTLAGVDLKRPLADMLEAADAVLGAIAAHGLYPLLVIDDSDAFTRLPGDDRTAWISVFFGPVLRSIADLRAGIVVAVHDRYLEMDAFRHVSDGILETPITVPELTDVHISEILSRRVDFAMGGATAGDLFTEDALQRLYTLYRGPAARNMRRVLVTCHQALLHAARNERALIEDDAVALAARENGLSI
jgi:tellurite resistance protein